ncbi:MAG: hypothetical protein ACTS2F_06885, partial [Thainema sp.]
SVFLTLAGRHLFVDAPLPQSELMEIEIEITEEDYKNAVFAVAVLRSALRCMTARYAIEVNKPLTQLQQTAIREGTDLVEDLDQDGRFYLVDEAFSEIGLKKPWDSSQLRQPD